MVEALAEFALGAVASLVATAISAGTSYAALPFFQRRKIQGRIDEATAEVVEPLLPFLDGEHVAEEQQRLLIRVCTDELRPCAEDSSSLFKGSLDGQKIFDDKYTATGLPRTIVEEGLSHVYALLFPRIATVLCRIPSAVKDWENQAWTENYRRLDELAAELRHLFQRLDSLQVQLTGDGDGVMSLARKGLAQRVGIELDLTGLRSDAPVAGKLQDFFVHPRITRTEQLEIVDSLEISSDSVARFLDNRCCGIVLGAPGSGKSTWSRWLQREALTDCWTGLPIRVELRRLDLKHLPSLHGLVRESLSQHLAEDFSAQRVRDWVGARRFVFLLDGFDEVARSARDGLLAWIEELRLAVGRCSLLVTSRPLTTGHLDRLDWTWLRWEIEPFDEPRIVDYIRRWYASTPLLVDGDRSIDPQETAARWRGDPTIGPLTSNPLLLSTLLMVHHLDGSLPSGRAELYRRYVDGMLGLWDDRRNVTAANVPLSIDQKRRILRSLAVHLQFAEKEEIEDSEAVATTRAALATIGSKDDAEAVLDTLRERSGLIVGPGVYSFIHKSVGEYFVADAVVQGDQRDPLGKRVDRFCLFEHRADDRWNVVTFLWAGLAAPTDVESFLEESLKASDIPITYGILLDQYERFTRDVRRHYLLRLLSMEREKFEVALLGKWAHGWCSSKGRPELWIREVMLRGLRPQQLDDLLVLAMTDGTISWSDVEERRGLAGDMLWMTAVRRHENIEEWKRCLRVPPPEPSASAWHYWVAENLLGYVCDMPSGERSEFIRAYQRVLPHVASYLPIALMSIVVNARAAADNPFATSTNRVGNALLVLPMVSGIEVGAGMLGQTATWHMPFHTGERPDVDLLSEFHRVIEEHATADASEEQKRPDALDYVDKLCAKRDVAGQHGRDGD